VKEGIIMELSMEEKLEIVKAIREKDAKKLVDPTIIDKYPVKETKEMFVKTRQGEAHIYIHYPRQGEAPYSLYVNIHGGGFIKGHFQVDELFCRKISNKVNCVVIDIDYKTAPEGMFPYALNECYDVIKWAYENSEELKIDKNRIAVGGHSAGGTLTAGICLMINKSKEFPIIYQILDYPPLDLYTDPELKKTFANPIIPHEKARIYNDMYIKEEDRTNILASPVLAATEQLRGLPPTLIITAELDSLCDEGEKYASMLIEAGVKVTAKRFIGSNHGFTINLRTGYEESVEMIVNALKNAFY
jgi:acetyl esterase